MCKGSRGNMNVTMGQLKKMLEINMTQCDAGTGKEGGMCSAIKAVMEEEAGDSFLVTQSGLSFFFQHFSST